MRVDQFQMTKAQRKPKAQIPNYHVSSSWDDAEDQSECILLRNHWDLRIGHSLVIGN
jgi:hypothetical protein